jgi:STAS-like domain of unknown function (DUF4325)
MTNSTLIFEPTFKLTNLTVDFLSGKSGLEIGKKLDAWILKNPEKELQVSLEGIKSVSPSFINGAFLFLIELYGENYFREFVKFKNANSRVALAVSGSIKQFLAHRTAFFKELPVKKLCFVSDGSSDAQHFIENLAKPNDFGIDFNQNIANSASCFIGILSQIEQSSNFLNQINQIISFQKPTLLLLKKNIALKIPAEIQSNVQIVRYDPKNVLTTVRKINLLIQNQKIWRQNKENSNFGEAVLWGLIGVGAFQLLFGGKK